MRVSPWAWSALACGAVLWAGPAPAAEEAPAGIVAVHLQSPEFQVQEMKYRVLFLKTENKVVPLGDYDFAAALADEMANVLSEGGTGQWRPATSGDGLDLPALWDDKTRPAKLAVGPGTARLLVVDVFGYGAQVLDLSKDKFFISSRLKLVDLSSGRRLWQKKRMLERIDLVGKMADLQADDQKGLKVGINAALEEFCRGTRDELRKARVSW